MDPQKAHAVPKTFTAYKGRRLINAEDGVHLSFSFVSLRGFLLMSSSYNEILKAQRVFDAYMSGI